MRFIRHRSSFLYGGALIAIIASIASDPDNGLSTLLGGLAIIQGIWAVTFAHLGRKALLDYEDADQRKLFRKALEHPIGAGLALIAMAIVFVGLLLVFSPRAHADTMPEGFIKYGPILKAEQAKFWPDHPDPSLLASLVEQESCITLKHPRCWNPSSRLKTSREEGAGLGQITRAYRSDGSVRFDTLSDLRSRYAFELSELTWSNIYERPDLQLRALVIMSRDAATVFKTARDWLQFGDAAYNGGVFGVQKERRACKIASSCDPALWFGHVERHCLKSRQPIYAGRSACDINREHVRNVFLVRKLKYVGKV